MSYARYIHTLKSKEQRGATQPNIVRLGFNSDADALTFKDNLNSVVSGHVATVNKILSEDYSRPYPAGNGWNARFAFRSATGVGWQMRLYDIIPDTDLSGLADDLIAAGIRAPWDDGPVATSVVITMFPPSTFVG